MPKDAPQLKKDAIKGYGAEIIFFDRAKDDLDAVIKEQVEQKKMTYVSPFDHPDVIAGQGTCAKELFDEVGKLDHFFCGVGGGGLISGCSLVAEAVSPGCKIWGVEPDAAHDAAISLEQNRVVSIPN